MQNEQELICSLLHLLNVAPSHEIPHPFLRGQTIHAHERWPAGDPDLYDIESINRFIAGALSGSSWNYPMLAIACAILARRPGAESVALGWFMALKSKHGWMGREIGSRNDYGIMHLAGFLVGTMAKSATLQGISWESLDLFRFWGSTGCPITGERSVLAGRDQYGLIDEVIEYAAGVENPPKHKPETWDRLLVQALLPQLGNLTHRQYANPKWVTATLVTFYVGDDGRAVILSSNTDGNTLPSLGVLRFPGDCAWRDMDWIPPVPWPKRIREVNDHAACVVDSVNHVVRYTSTVFGNHVYPLPSKNVRVYVLGNGSTQPI